MKLKKKMIFYNKSKIIIIFIGIIIVTYIMLKSFGKESLPYLFEYAKSESINISNMLINKAIYDEIYLNEIKEVVLIEKNNNNEIVNINYDTKELNIILYNVSENILKSINDLEKSNIKDLNIKYYSKKDMIYYVPIGIIYNIPILTDVSPKIPYRVNFLGSVDSFITTNIKEYGINNSLVEVLLNISMNIQVIFPFLSEKIEINKQLPISSNIIQGKVPTYYGGIITSTSPIKNN